jgi:hypothetical protein
MLFQAASFLVSHCGWHWSDIRSSFSTTTADPPCHARRQLQLKRLLPLRGRLHGLFGPGFATPPRSLLRPNQRRRRLKNLTLEAEEIVHGKGAGRAWGGGLDRGQCCPREHAQATQCVHVRVATSGNLAKQVSSMCDAISDSLRSVSTVDGASCERASLPIRPSATRCQGRPSAVKRARSYQVRKALHRAGPLLSWPRTDGGHDFRRAQKACRCHGTSVL